MSARGPDIERRKISIRQATGGRAVMMADCGFGLAIVPVDEERTSLAAPGDDHDGSDRVRTVKGFTFYHEKTGARLLPKGWFFTSYEAAFDALRAIGRRWPVAFDTPDINAFLPLAGPLMDMLRRTPVIAGKWNELARALDGLNEDEWKAGAEERRRRMQDLPNRRGVNRSEAA